MTLAGALTWEQVAVFWEQYGGIIRILLIIVLGIIARWLLLVALGRVVSKVVTGVKKNQQVLETREMTQSPLVAARVVQRTRTLGSVGGNIITITIGLLVIVLILGQLGINLTTVLASAGFVAAGLAFGAQNIVKDLLNGIFMVFEDQLGVGDSVIVGEISGTVEAVGIRITQVRSVDGTLWFIRNGEILMLGNQSHDWGRALLDITLDANQDLEAAEQAIVGTARDLLRTAPFARKVLSLPEVWGLESVTSDRATMRLVVKTRPDTQSEISRALRAAIKQRFDADGIRMAPESPMKSLQSGADDWRGPGPGGVDGQIRPGDLATVMTADMPSAGPARGQHTPPAPGVPQEPRAGETIPSAPSPESDHPDLLRPGLDRGPQVGSIPVISVEEAAAAASEQHAPDLQPPAQQAPEQHQTPEQPSRAAKAPRRTPKKSRNTPKPTEK